MAHLVRILDKIFVLHALDLYIHLQRKSFAAFRLSDVNLRVDDGIARHVYLASSPGDHLKRAEEASFPRRRD